MRKLILGVLGGYSLWWVFAFGLFGMARVMSPAFSEADGSFNFTFGMLMMRFVLSAVCSFAAGFGAVSMALGNTRAGWITAGLLFATFLPVDLALWSAFPVWYHLLSLAALVGITGFSGAWAGRFFSR